MSSLILNSYSPLANTIKLESGDKSSHIWLLVNPKYPSVHYDIWTPILEIIQDIVYRKLQRRIDSKAIYMRNTVSDIGIVSSNSNLYTNKIADDIATLSECILEFHPKLLITFGSVPYELVNRICKLVPDEQTKYWSTANLEYEFEQSIENFDISRMNRIPLPRRVVTKHNYLEDYNCFLEDRESYFRHVGSKIADKIIENKDKLNIWIH